MYKIDRRGGGVQKSYTRKLPTVISGLKITEKIARKKIFIFKKLHNIPKLIC